METVVLEAYYTIFTVIQFYKIIEPQNFRTKSLSNNHSIPKIISITTKVWIENMGGGL